jgi:predicted ArsR family transcriptional regulator
MSGDRIRKKILDRLLEAEKPLRSWEIAEKMGISVPSSTMHLLRLIKAGYVSTPQRGYYTITVHGKEKLGRPTTVSVFRRSLPLLQGHWPTSTSLRKQSKRFLRKNPNSRHKVC